MGLTVVKYSMMTANFATRSMVSTEYAGNGSRKHTNFSLVNVLDKALYITGG